MTISLPRIERSLNAFTALSHRVYDAGKVQQHVGERQSSSVHGAFVGLELHLAAVSVEVDEDIALTESLRVGYRQDRLSAGAGDDVGELVVG